MLPQISIQQAFSRIAISYTPMQWNIETKQAAMELHRSDAQINIQQGPGELTIDQTEAFAQEGRLKPLDFAVQESKKAEQTVAEGTAETAQLGDSIAHSARKGGGWSELAMRYAFRQVELTPALVPAPFSVHVCYQPTPVREHADMGHVELQVQRPSLNVDFHPGVARTYVEQQGYVKIDAPPFTSLGHDYLA